MSVMASIAGYIVSILVPGQKSINKKKNSKESFLGLLVFFQPKKEMITQSVFDHFRITSILSFKYHGNDF